MSFLQRASATDNLTEYTFSSQNLGTADAKRHIIVCAGARGTTSGLVLSSLSVAGVAATIVGQITNDANNFNCEAMAIAEVPTGTSGDVVVTWNVGVLRCDIRMYELLLDSATPSDTLTNSGGLSGDPTGTIDVPEDGTAIAGSNTANATSCTWEGVTEDADAQTELFTASSASDEFASEQTGLTITADWANPSNTVLVAASWAAPSAGDSVSPDAVAIHWTPVAPAVSLSRSVSPVATNWQPQTPAVALDRSVSPVPVNWSPVAAVASAGVIRSAEAVPVNWAPVAPGLALELTASPVPIAWSPVAPGLTVTTTAQAVPISYTPQQPAVSITASPDPVETAWTVVTPTFSLDVSTSPVALNWTPIVAAGAVAGGEEPAGTWTGTTRPTTYAAAARSQTWTAAAR